jgi:predicted nucleic acid-binding protein
MYLVDTNVISESRKGAAANLGVLDCSQVWGRLMSPQSSHPVDKQIAAIALIHGLYVVTRNIADFSTTGVNLLNPFV